MKEEGLIDGFWNEIFL